MKEARNKLIKRKEHLLKNEPHVYDNKSFAAVEVECINYTLNTFDEIERKTIGQPDKLELLVKQWEELSDKFNIAMKALESIHACDNIPAGLKASEAIEKINALIEKE